MSQEKKLTISEHLQELRGRLIKALAIWGTATVLSFFFAGRFLRVLLSPAQGIKPIYIELTEMLGIYIKIALLGGLILALPFVLYQIMMFVTPALTQKEKKTLYTYLPGVTIAFLVGVVFGYFVLLPPALRFLLAFGSDIATPQIRIANYVNTMVMLLFWIGVSFETPFVMLILSRVGIVSPRGFARHRRLAILGAFILAGIITPTFDPVNQALVALPIIVLYEVGILMSRIAARQRRKISTALSKADE